MEMQTTSEMGKLTPQNIWEEKDTWEKSESTSYEYWNNEMDEQSRESVLEVVDRALDRMRDTLEEWVPYALRIEQGEFLDVTFRMCFTDLEAELRAQQQITERKIREAAEDTVRLVGFGETEEEVTDAEATPA